MDIVENFLDPAGLKAIPVIPDFYGPHPVVHFHPHPDLPWRICVFECMFNTVLHERLYHKPGQLDQVKQFILINLPLQIILEIVLDQRQIMLGMLQLLRQSDMLVRRRHNIPQAVRQMFAHL
ncbi:hypothetical protein D3C81_1763010 [compost metagenome]